MNTKNKVFIILGVVAVLGLGIFALTRINFNKSDNSEMITVTDENAQRDYALVEVSKEEFENMDEHQFLSKVLPILKAYSGKNYTTLVFGDGTGIYFPFSDSTKSAQYCEIDENGLPTQQLGIIMISGTSVTYNEAPIYSSKKTIDAYKYAPNEFVNDSFALCVTDDILYVSLAETKSEEEAKTNAINFCTQFIKNGYDATNQQIYVKVGYLYGYIVNPNTLEATFDDSVVEAVSNIFN